MATHNAIHLTRRSSTPGAVPTTAQLALGEIAINTYDGRLFIKQDNGTPAVIQVGGSSGTAGVTSFNTRTGAVTLSSLDVTNAITVLSPLFGGTGFTGYTTGDTLYASNSTTLAKLAIGTTGQVLTVSGGAPAWVTPASGGGTAYPIGTIVDSPTAPSDGGTWFECNGQTISQTTYASLFTAIGHDYLRYRFSRGTLPAYSTTGTGSNGTIFMLYDGSAWIANNGTGTQKSTNGGATWSAGAALPVTIGGTTSSGVAGSGLSSSWTNGSGTALISGYDNNAQQFATYRTTNGGTSWAAVTLPANTSAEAWLFNNNGANVVGIQPGTTKIIISADSGATWSTSGSTLPTSIPANTSVPGNGGAQMWWTGSRWYILIGPTLMTTTTATGASGWTTASTAVFAFAPLSRLFDVVPGSSTVALPAMSNLISSDAGVTALNQSTNKLVTNFTNYIVWNGKHFFSHNTLMSSMMRSDGTLYETNVDYGTNGSPMTSGSLVFPGQYQFNANGRADTVNNRMVLALGTTVYIYEPSITTTTNFSVPKGNIDGGTVGKKLFIKAL